MAQAHNTISALPRKLVRAISSRKLLPIGLESASNFAKDGKDRTSRSWRVLGIQRTLADDFQHMCLELDWLPLIMLILVVYSFFSVLFGVAFFGLLSAGAPFVGDWTFSSRVEDCLWMSVTNLVTIGYGSLTPGSRPGYILATVEHFVGILLSAILLGIVVSKASLPTSRIVFSDHIIFTTRNGEPTVIFRVGNTRGNFLLNPEVRVSYFRRLETIEGESVWTGTRLEFEEPPQLAPAFNLAHKVTEDSPLYGMTQEDLQNAGGDLSVVLGATDDHSLQTLHARKLYTKENVMFNMRFGDVLAKDSNGKKMVNFERFHDVIPLEGLSPWVGWKAKAS